jgi:hypothetical protein
VSAYAFAAAGNTLATVLLQLYNLWFTKHMAAAVLQQLLLPTF